MTQFIPSHIIREVLTRVDIIQIIQEYVSLKRSGANYSGLCPFHEDKDPSFSVNPSRGFFYCFGCHEKGDVISFVRKIRGLSFAEALQVLADKVGIEIPQQDLTDAERQREKERKSVRAIMMEINKLTADFFHRKLLSALRGDAGVYLTNRGITRETVETFNLGLADNEWQSLHDFLAGNNVNLKLAETLGLIIKGSKGGYYDRFRGRLMFPILNIHDNVIGFSGRILEKTADDVAKYMNSPDSEIYHKGEVLFGLTHAKGGIRKKGYAIIVEGNIDLLSLFQNGFDNTVAPLGTALTLRQLHLLKRYTDRIMLLNDGDDAGRNAAVRALPICLEAGFDVRAPLLPDGEDPDSFIRHQGPEVLQKLFDDALPLLDVVIHSAIEKMPDQTISSKVKVLEQVAPYLTRLEKPMEKALYLQRLSERMRIDPRLLSNYLRFPERMAAHAAQAGETPVALPQRELKLIQLIALYPAFIQQAHERNIIELFTHDTLRWIFQEMVYHYLTVERIDFEKIIEGLPDDAMKTVIARELFKNDFNESNVAKSFEDLVHRLDQARKKKERLAIQSIIQSERKGYDLETLERWQQVAFDEITGKHH